MKIRNLALALLTATLLAVPGPATANHAHDWPQCQEEDGSGQHRCVWDAKHQGNGLGTSVKIVNGGTDDATYTLISHRRAKHLLGHNHTR